MVNNNLNSCGPIACSDCVSLLRHSPKIHCCPLVHWCPWETEIHHSHPMWPMHDSWPQSCAQLLTTFGTHCFKGCLLSVFKTRIEGLLDGMGIMVNLAVVGKWHWGKNIICNLIKKANKLQCLIDPPLLIIFYIMGNSVWIIMLIVSELPRVNKNETFHSFAAKCKSERECNL